MTDQNQTPDKQNAPQPPLEDSAVTPESAAPSESVSDIAAADADKTLELPGIDLPEADDAALKAEQSATDAGMPPLEAPDPAEDVTAVTETVAAVPQPTEVMPQVSTSDASTETSDFTLTDITLSEAEGLGLAGWIRGLKNRLTPAAKPAKAAPTGPAAKSKRWNVRPWQWALIGVGGLVLLFAVFVAVDAGLYYKKVHHGISVADHDLSGMSESKAQEALAGFAMEAEEQPITLRSGNLTWKVLPGDLGTVIDIPATVSKAMDITREGNFFSDLGNKIVLYFRSQDLLLEGTIDDAKMDALLGRIASTLDMPATNATLVSSEGSVEVVEGKQGSVVDQETLRSDLTRLLLTFHSTELPIPMLTTFPDLKAVDIEPALAQVNVMITSDLELTHDGETIATLKPAEILAYVDIEPQAQGEQIKAVPVLSAEKMIALFDAVQPQVETPAVDATFEMDLEVEEPYPLVLVDGIDGRTLDREATAAALTQAALSASARSAQVALKPLRPERTADDVRAMGIKDLLGDYRTTPYVGTKDRQHNVRLATELCSGTFLAPGEEFNTDKRLGIRDEAHGWETAPGITGPGKLEDVYGGGICQVSTTLFNAALLAGLEITERHNHSIYINHYPWGRDATVTSGGKNMRFRNDTDHYVFIYGWSTGINTRFWVWGVSDGREVLPIKFSGFSIGGNYPTETILNKSLAPGATKEIFEGQRSRSCSVERTIVYADGTRKTESWASRWAMMPKVVEVGPTPTTTTSPATTTTAP